MALAKTNTGSFSTLITDSATKNSWRVTTVTDNTQNSKRVISVSIHFTKGASDATVNCTDANMKALHDAVVDAFYNNIGSSKGTN